jgi:hypothetical protein
MNNVISSNFTEILDSLDKMETITKVLNQTIFEDKEFNAADSQNLCSVLLREINYTKSKISKLENNF